jgi:AraC-like DNA-binding protein
VKIEAPTKVGTFGKIREMEVRSTSRKHRVAARLVTPILAAAKGAGVDPLRLLSDAGLSADLASKSGTDEHVTLAQYFHLWEQAMALTGCADLPLRAGMVLGTDSFGVIGFSIVTSPTIGGAFQRLSRYCTILHTAASWTQVKDKGRLSLVWDVEKGSALGTRCAYEFTLSEAMHFSRIGAARPFDIVEVRFPHAAPQDDSSYRRHFRAPLRWNAPHAALVLEPNIFDVPMAKADPHLLAYFERQADALAAQYATEEELSTRVRRLAIEAFPGGPPSLETVARRIGVSPRSLRRRLADEGTTFQALVESTRSELAKRYLQDPKLTVSEIAFLVGFSELSPFQRAFRRWTGLPPRAYREQELAGGFTSARRGESAG